MTDTVGRDAAERQHQGEPEWLERDRAAEESMDVAAEAGGRAAGTGEWTVIIAGADLSLARALELKGESVAVELGLLAQRITDPDLAAVLWALEASHRRGDDWARKVAGKARHYLERTNAGPRTRVQEVEGLERIIKRGIVEDAPATVIAERVVRWLRVCPLLAADTCIPSTRSGRWPPEDREAAITAVVYALAWRRGQTRDPEKLCKAIMRRLGCPPKRARNLFAYRYQR